MPNPDVPGDNPALYAALGNAIAALGEGLANMPGPPQYRAAGNMLQRIGAVMGAQVGIARLNSAHNRSGSTPANDNGLLRRLAA